MLEIDNVTTTKTLPNGTVIDCEGIVTGIDPTSGKSIETQLPKSPGGGYGFLF